MEWGGGGGGGGAKKQQWRTIEFKVGLPDTIDRNHPFRTENKRKSHKYV